MQAGGGGGGGTPGPPFWRSAKLSSFLGASFLAFKFQPLRPAPPWGPSEHPGKEMRSNCWLQESEQSAESRWTLDFGLHLPRGWGQVELGR